MIDTINFKWHNIRRFESKIERFLKSDRVTVGGLQFVEFKNSLLETKEKQFIKSKLTSGSYDINFDLNLLDNTITFEFSVPKYMYGHNLKHYGSRDTLYEDLLSFMDRFFTNEFGLRVPYHDIELCRIDFCYNYWFEYFENKLAFQQVQHDLLSNQFKSKVLNWEGESVMYKTRDYSFKIYDKSKEFYKHDYQKIANRKGSEFADKLLSVTKNCLRSEISLRSRKMNYEFYSNVEDMTQVSSMYRSKYKRIAKVYNKVESRLTILADNINKAIQGKSYKIHIPKEVKRFFDYDEKMIEEFINVRFADDLNWVKDYKASDINFFCTKNTLALMQTYNKMRKPKPIFLGLTSFEKKAQKQMTFLDKIYLEKNLFYSLFGMFENNVNQLSSNVGREVNPIQIINQHREQLTEVGIKCTPLIKYLHLSGTKSDKWIVRNKLMSARTIRTRKAEIRQINDWLERIGSGQRIGKYVLKEVIRFSDIETNSYICDLHSRESPPT